MVILPLNNTLNNIFLRQLLTRTKEKILIFGTNKHICMEFRTKIHITPSTGFITHRHSILLLGSCFSENIGSRLQKYKFDVDINPFGTLYNPRIHSARTGKTDRQGIYAGKRIVRSRESVAQLLPSFPLLSYR